MQQKIIELKENFEKDLSDKEKNLQEITFEKLKLQQTAFETNKNDKINHTLSFELYMLEWR